MGGGSSKAYRLESGNGKMSGPRPDWLQHPSKKLAPLSKNKFDNMKGIGKGKFGLVFLAKHGASKKCVAIKYMSKQFIHECKSIARINQELILLQKIDHPYMVHCFGGFDTPECIALVFDYCMGGEFFTYLKKETKIPEGYAKFYFCEIALAIFYLHDNLGYVYRDLKPENILIDYDGHLRLCDFGFAVPVNKGDDGSDLPLNDGCGTAMYVAPEIAGGFMQRSHGYPVDWWGLGCVLVEMVTGNAPFGDIETSSKFEVFNNINEKSPSLGMSMSGPCKKLCKGLLDKDASKRFNWTHVRGSDWCKDVNWDDMLNKRVGAPWLPSLTTQPSTDNFVSWDDMVLPSSAADSAATGYCSSVTLPRLRHSLYSEGMSGGTSGGSGAGGDGSRVSPAVSDAGGSRNPSPITVGASGSSTPQGTGRKPLRKGNTMSNLTLEADEDRRPPGAGNLKRQNTMNDGGNGVGSPKKGMRKGKSSKNLGS